MGVVLVHIFHHFFGGLDAWLRIFGIGIFAVRQISHPFRVSHFVDVARVHELHGIPIGIASPVLPVLHDTVQGNLQIAVFVQYTTQFIWAFVTFTALPESHGPKRKHGGLSCQLTYAGNDTVLCAVFINNVIVAHQSGFAVETGFLRCVGEKGR